MMEAFLEMRALQRAATGRNVIVAFLAAFALVTVLTSVLSPPLRELTGFEPFDVQYPISRESIAIQLGAYEAQAAAAYDLFAVGDFLLLAALALFTALAWAWLMKVAPNKLYDLITRGGVLVMPFLPALADIIENICFLLIVHRSVDLTSGIIEAAVAAHRAKMMLLTVNNSIWVVLITVTAVVWVQAWRGRK